MDAWFSSRCWERSAQGERQRSPPSAAKGTKWPQLNRIFTPRWASIVAAQPPEIRSAYRLLSKQHHPDVNPGSEDAVARTMVLNEAYATLSDPRRRRAYDQHLQGAGGSGKAGGGAGIQRNIGQDVHLRVDELLKGVTLHVQVDDPVNAGVAETYELVIPPETAPNARFRIPRKPRLGGGVVQIRVRVRPDSRFKARGSDLRYDLRLDFRRAIHGGSEMIRGADGAVLRVEVPAGIARGEVLRVAGHGLPKPRGGRGDLLVRVTYRAQVKVTRRRA